MVRIGIVGTGIMGNIHAGMLEKIRGAKVTACCDVDEGRARKFADKWHVPNFYTDYKTMISAGNLDAVYNITVDGMHAPVSLFAIDRGLAVMCEKPLATTLADAKKMAAAAARKGVVNMINFTRRNASGLQAAAAAVADGKIGRVIHVEASYLQSWLAQAAWGDWRTDPLWTWRLSTRHGSTGALGDIGCHIYDMVRFLCGDITKISCQLSNVDKNVRGNKIGPYVLDANDGFVSNVTFANGAVGAIHATRWASGQMDSIRARVYGDKGAVDIDLDKSKEEYRIITGPKALLTADWKTVKCKPTPNNSERFVKAIETGTSCRPDFSDGCKVQAYLHHSFLSSEKEKTCEVKV